jgi:hypothetical protein
MKTTSTDPQTVVSSFCEHAETDLAEELSESFHHSCEQRHQLIHAKTFGQREIRAFVIGSASTHAHS